MAKVRKSVWRADGKVAGKMAYRRDPTVAGRDYTIVTFSIPAADLEQLDKYLKDASRSRSEFIRSAMWSELRRLGVL